MKGFVYSLVTSTIDLDPLDVPVGASTKTEFNRVHGLKKLAIAHSGAGISSEEMGIALDIRHKIDDAVKAEKLTVILDKAEADFLISRLAFYRFTVANPDLFAWCQSIKYPKEATVELAATG